MDRGARRIAVADDRLLAVAGRGDRPAGRRRDARRAAVRATSRTDGGDQARRAIADRLEAGEPLADRAVDTDDAAAAARYHPARDVAITTPAAAAAPAPLASPPDRLAGSAWLILRGGRNDAVAGGQLGASQMGARVTYTLVPRVALAARVSAPLRGRGAEVALGVDWQPIDLPVHVIAEQRVAVDGGRGGAALFAAGGVDPTPSRSASLSTPTRRRAGSAAAARPSCSPTAPSASPARSRGSVAPGSTSAAVPGAGRSAAPPASTSGRAPR